MISIFLLWAGIGEGLTGPCLLTCRARGESFLAGGFTEEFTGGVGGFSRDVTGGGGHGIEGGGGMGRFLLNLSGLLLEGCLVFPCGGRGAGLLTLDLVVGSSFTLTSLTFPEGAVGALLRAFLGLAFSLGSSSASDFIC